MFKTYRLWKQKQRLTKNKIGHKEFQTVLSEYRDTFLSNSFTKDRNQVYKSKINKDFKLQFILSKWGWNPETGHEFIPRIFDYRNADQYGNIIDINGDMDIKIDRIEEADPSLKPRLDPLISDDSIMGWYPFMDTKSLANILDITLVPILSYANDYIEKRLSGEIPVRMHVRSTEERTKAFTDSIEEMVKNITGDKGMKK